MSEQMTESTDQQDTMSRLFVDDLDKRERTGLHPDGANGDGLVRLTVD